MGLTLVDAVRAVQIPVNTAARLLRILEAGRFLRSDEHGHYRPGAQLLQLGTLALDGDPVRSSPCRT